MKWEVSSKCYIAKLNAMQMLWCKAVEMCYLEWQIMSLWLSLDLENNTCLTLLCQHTTCIITVWLIFFSPSERKSACFNNFWMTSCSDLCGNSLGSLVWKNFTGIHRVLTSTWWNTFEVNKSRNQAFSSDISVWPHKWKNSQTFQETHGKMAFSIPVFVVGLLAWNSHNSNNSHTLRNQST